MTNKITIIKGRRFSDVRIACKRDSLNDYHDISIRGNRHVVINESKESYLAFSEFNTPEILNIFGTMFKLNSILRTSFGSAKGALILQKSNNDRD